MAKSGGQAAPSRQRNVVDAWARSMQAGLVLADMAVMAVVAIAVSAAGVINAPGRFAG
jgi:hypothetical protein